MFAKSQSPRIFGLPPGVNFSRSFVDGLKSRLIDYPPEKSTTIKIYVNSNRMLQKIKTELKEQLKSTQGDGIKVSDINQSQIFVSAEYDEIKANQETQKKEMIEMKKRLECQAK